MAGVEISHHARRRMRQRGVSTEEVLLAWLNPEMDRPSTDHPGAGVRTGRLPNGDEVTVVAIHGPETFEVITVW